MKKKSKELLHWNCMYQNEVWIWIWELMGNLKLGSKLSSINYQMDLGFPF